MTMDHSRKMGILFAVVATQFAIPFMISAVGVCLPSIGREFDASAMSLSLVESVFMCANAMLLLPIGRAADILGRGAIFLIGLILFSLFSVTLTFSPNMDVLLFIRALQGMGGAMTLATGLALLYDAFPSEERGRALGISMAGIFLGISAGPFLGGILISLFGWRSCFYVGMAPCAVAVLFCVRNLDWKLSPKPGERFDWWGAVTSVLGIGLVVYGSAHVESGYGWWIMGAGVLFLALFVAVEARVAHPLMDLDLFLANRSFSFGIFSIFIVSGGAFTAPFLLNLYLQFGRDMAPEQAGMALVVQPVVQCIVSPLCGRLADRTSPHLLSGLGSLLAAVGLGLAMFLGPDSSMLHVYLVLGVVGLGIGIFSSPSMMVVMSAVEPKDYGIASALTGQARTSGLTACMTVITMVLAFFLGSRALGPDALTEYLAAMRALFIGFTCMGMAGALAAFFSGTKRERATA